MSGEGFTSHHRAIGRSAAWAISILLVAYAITMILGFLSLRSPLDPIGEPYFTIRNCGTIATGAPSGGARPQECQSIEFYRAENIEEFTVALDFY